MGKDYLDPKQSVGVKPYAGGNLEAVSACCLDLNTKWAYLVRGRVHFIWVYIFTMIVMPPFFITAAFLSDTEGAVLEATGGSLFIDLVFALFISLGVYIWRGHIPVRFNRINRTVSFHRKGKTYVSDWDDIRAYLELSHYVHGVDPQVNIEFQKENGTTVTVPLLAESRVEDNHDAAALWEFIRVYMEEGPDKLPQKRKERFCERIWRGLPEKSLYRELKSDWLLVFLFSPVIALSRPTDYLYCLLAKWIKAKPFPPEMTEPCLRNETAKEKEEKQLVKIRSQRESTQQRIHSVEQSLRHAYHEWFIEFRFPLHEHSEFIDGLPYSWHRVTLGDLVEINPGHSINPEQHTLFLPSSAVPGSGMLVERNQLQRCTVPTSTTFRYGDTVFPRSLPDKGQTAFIEFVAYEEVGCGSEDLVVMRGKRVSPEFTYCLATNRHLRECAAVDVGSVLGFPLGMPPLWMLEEFDSKYAKTAFREIEQLVTEGEKLRIAEERILARWSTAACCASGSVDDTAAAGPR